MCCVRRSSCLRQISENLCTNADCSLRVSVAVVMGFKHFKQILDILLHLQHHPSINELLPRPGTSACSLEVRV